MSMLGKIGALLMTFPKPTKVTRLADYRFMTDGRNLDHHALWAEVLEPSNPVVADVLAEARHGQVYDYGRPGRFSVLLCRASVEERCDALVLAAERFLYVTSHWCICKYGMPANIAQSVAITGMVEAQLTTLRNSFVDLIEACLEGHSYALSEQQGVRLLLALANSFTPHAEELSYELRRQTIRCLAVSVPQGQEQQLERQRVVHAFLKRLDVVLSGDIPSGFTLWNNILKLTRLAGLDPIDYVTMKWWADREHAALDICARLVALLPSQLADISVEIRVPDQPGWRAMPQSNNPGDFRYLLRAAHEAFVQRKCKLVRDSFEPLERGLLITALLRADAFLANEIALLSENTRVQTVTSIYSQGFEVAQSLARIMEATLKCEVAMTTEQAISFLLAFRSDSFSVFARRALHQPKAIQLIETMIKRDPSPSLLEEARVLYAWLNSIGGRDQNVVRTAKTAIERALVDVGGENRTSVPSLIPAAGGESVQQWCASATDRLPPPDEQTYLGLYLNKVVLFYADLADVRKLTEEHLAFIERLLQEDEDPKRWVAHYRALATDGGCSLAKYEASARIGDKPYGDLTEEFPHDWSLPVGVKPGLFAHRLRLIQANLIVLGALSEQQRNAWTAIYDHARMLATKSAPSRRWLDEGARILEPLAFKERLALLEMSLSHFTTRASSSSSRRTSRGLIYLSTRLPIDRIGTLLIDFAVKHCFIAGEGRDERLGNACIWALGHRLHGDGLSYLARLSNRVGYPTTKRRIAQMMDDAARAAGISAVELEERLVPKHGLKSGQRVFLLGENGDRAVIRLADRNQARVSFLTTQGLEIARPNATMKADKTSLKNLRALVTEIDADVAVQLARLQRCYLGGREIPVARWIEHYRDHPLMGPLTRRLIWTVSQNGTEQSFSLSGDGSALDLDGRQIILAGNIRLWHPIDATIDVVLAWRRQLAEAGIVQPFRQAHREIYRVTDAERATRDYSNRFAGHIVNQSVLIALARQSGWHITRRICQDVANDEPTYLTMPEHCLMAELFTAGTGGDESVTTLHGAYAYLTTDQIRFHRLADGQEPSRFTAKGPETIGIVSVLDTPPIVFSETMRCCDLFTSVASIAADQQWLDRGRDAERPSQWHADANAYWTRHAFGELTMSAETRREMLATLIPALSPDGKLRIDGNWVHVTGKLHTYRIHIGSGAVQRGAAGGHVCIVPAGAPGASRVALPFEGDGMLSIIVSKAMLLCDDDKILDPVILRQIA